MGFVTLVAALLLGAPHVFELREGTLTYALVHKLHEFSGSTHALEGKALVTPEGAGRVQVRAKVASFDSGNSNRDEHMREATHEVLHPLVELKGTFKGLAVPVAGPTTSTVDAIIELNGVKQAASIPVTLTPEGPRLRAKFTFPLSLDAFHIDRPQLLFVKVEDRMVMSGDLSFEEQK